MMSETTNSTAVGNWSYPLIYRLSGVTEEGASGITRLGARASTNFIQPFKNTVLSRNLGQNYA